jgi:hypothetical protein
MSAAVAFIEASFILFSMNAVNFIYEISYGIS